MRLIRDGEKGGKGVWRLGKREIIYLSLQCHHQNDSCIKMGRGESHFNVSEGSDEQSHKTVSTNRNLFEEKGRAEAASNRGPSAYQPNALPLGQTGSLNDHCHQMSSFIPPTLRWHRKLHKMIPGNESSTLRLDRTGEGLACSKQIQHTAREDKSIESYSKLSTSHRRLSNQR